MLQPDKPILTPEQQDLADRIDLLVALREKAKGGSAGSATEEEDKGFWERAKDFGIRMIPGVPLLHPPAPLVEGFKKLQAFTEATNAVANYQFDRLPKGPGAEFLEDVPFIGHRSLDEEAKAARAKGIKPGFMDWRVALEAYRNTDQPWGSKFLGELILDPLNLAPGVGFTKVPAKLGAKLGIKGAAQAIPPQAISPLGKTLQEKIAEAAAKAPPPEFATYVNRVAPEIFDEITNPKSLDEAVGTIKGSQFLSRLVGWKLETPWMEALAQGPRHAATTAIEFLGMGRAVLEPLMSETRRKLVGLQVLQDDARSTAKSVAVYYDNVLTQLFPDRQGGSLLTEAQVKKILPSVHEQWGKGSVPGFASEAQVMTNFHVMLDEVSKVDLDEYYNLTASQKQVLYDLHALMGGKDELMKKRGLDPTEMWGNRYHMDYWPRQVDKEARFKAKGGTPPPRELGRKEFFEFDRKYGSYLEGRAAGVNYIDDFGANLESFLRATDWTVADKEFIDWAHTYDPALKLFRKERSQVQALRAVSRMVLGEEITPHQLILARAFAPGLVDDLLQGSVKASTETAEETAERAAKRLAAETAGEVVREAPPKRLVLGEEEGIDQARRQGALDAVETLVKDSDAKFVALNDLRNNFWIDKSLADINMSEEMLREIGIVLKGNSRLLDQMAESKIVDLSRLLRFVGTGFDFGAPLIHGLLLLGRNPAAWSKASTSMMRSFIDPKFRSAYIAANIEQILRMKQDWGVTWSRSEFTLRGVREKADLTGTVLEKAQIFNVINRFDDAFSIYLDVARLEMGKALDPLIVLEKARGNLGAEREAGAILNKMLGGLDTVGLGMPHTQQQLMGVLLMFAPIYRMASYGLMLDVTKGGLRSREASKILRNLAGVGLAIGAMGRMSGNEDAFDPTTPRFLALKVPGGGYVGVGTAYLSNARMLAGLYKQIQKEGVDSLASLHNDNTLIRFTRSQSAPLTNITWSVLSGRTYTGDVLRDPDGEWLIGSSLGTVGGILAPFWLRTIVKGALGSESIANMTGGVSEIFGVRSLPEGVYLKRRTLRDFLVQTDTTDHELVAWRRGLDHEPTWSETPELFRIRLEQGSEELQAAEGEVAKEIKLRGSADQRTSLDFKMAMERNRVKVDGELKKIAENFTEGTLRGRAFRDKVREQAAILRALHASTLEDPRYADIKAFFEERRGKVMVPKEKEALGDFAFDDYMANVILSPDTHDAEGDFNAAAFRVIDAGWRFRFGETIWRYVQERRTARRDVPEVVREYWKSHERMQEYWEAPQATLSPESVDLYESYRQLPANQQSSFAQAHPIIPHLKKRVAEERLRIRKRNPDIDWILTKFYESTPVVEANRQRYAALLKNQ